MPPISPQGEKVALKMAHEQIDRVNADVAKLKMELDQYRNMPLKASHD